MEWFANLVFAYSPSDKVAVQGADGALRWHKPPRWPLHLGLTVASALLQNLPPQMSWMREALISHTLEG